MREADVEEMVNRRLDQRGRFARSALRRWGGGGVEVGAGVGAGVGTGVGGVGIGVGCGTLLPYSARTPAISSLVNPADSL
jgi:hypothetical protein